MKAAIAGVGCVTPLGAKADAVWQAIQDGTRAEAKEIKNTENGRLHRCHPVPAGCVEHLNRHPRLRRSSVISYFAVAAAEAALAAAGLKITSDNASRTAVVLAVSDGGVVYTRRFYEQIVKQGANTASPLLFPETVYNAPASHLAAFLGIDGPSYTLVGDNSVGHTALHFGAQLIALGEVDHCLVVGCEELDWILCEAFGDWRLSTSPLAEGAGAVVLGHEGSCTVSTHPGAPFARQRDAGNALESVIASLDLPSGIGTIVGSANGSFVDAHESKACTRYFPDAHGIFPARSLGQAPGASGLWQMVMAVFATRQEKTPRVLVPVIGFNQQANAAMIERTT